MNVYYGGSHHIDLRNNPTYVVLDLGCTRSMGSRKAIDAFAEAAPAYGISLVFHPCKTTFVFADSETSEVAEKCIVHFPTRPPCSTEIDVLEQGTVPILMSLPQMQNLGMSLNLHAKGNTITCPAFGLYDSPTETSTSGHIVIDLGSIQYYPIGPTKTPTRGVTFAARQDRDPDCPACRGQHRKHTCRKEAQGEVSRERAADPPESEEAEVIPEPPGLEQFPPPPVPTVEDKRSNDDRLAQKSLQNLIAKLDKEKNLEELHVKHCHMSTAQFKKRTTHLALPGRIYDLYDFVVKKCKFCNTRQPRPQRSRVSGLRAEEFGDLIFMDHGTSKVFEKTYSFLVILDGATSYITVYPCMSVSASEVIQKLHEWMDTYQCTPKAVCADMAFHNPVEFKEFYRLHDIKPIPTGPYTPWPNRAETTVRLFKKFFHILVENVAKGDTGLQLKDVTASQLMRKAATVRNTQVTASGRTPLELALGRRPRDLLDPANMNPQQLTAERTKDDTTNEELQRIAMRTHLEVQQREDIRRDLAANMKFVPAELVPGERVYYWKEDPTKIKQGKKGGSWIQVTIVEITGSMATVNTGTGVMQVNSTKLRRPYEKIELEDMMDSRERTAAPSYWQCQTDGTLDFS